MDVGTSSEMGYAGRHPLAIIDVVGAVGGHSDRGELLLVSPRSGVVSERCEPSL